VSEVVVARLGPADEQEARRFDAACDRPVDRGLAARYLADERHHLLAAYADGEPAGVATATEILRPDKPPELFLNELVVMPSFRRRGVAGSLLTRLEPLAAERGCIPIWVLTEEDNDGRYGDVPGCGRSPRRRHDGDVRDRSLRLSAQYRNIGLPST
jgi:GNAT superfamily N-acetyltransferase